ncbi:NAD-dependent epimerase/dehydratase family protein [Devosia riboflavina]|uniref:NAD-dependent epimerase/dehydratase family protein n=1 Tax=Devosia riboflavina TaxID=46914 RepID=UPI00068BB5B5|nr:NAD-dependent epimerase/dehydratase family protein [Devosia riboflavina]
MTNLMKPGDLCLVTGVSGYVASWLAKDLLDQGFRVRGTVRNIGYDERNRQLLDILPGVELAAADLRNRSGWAEAMQGVDWVFHVASPQAVPTETDRTGGAVSGTEFVLAAAFATPSVRKVVVTSSEAAIAYGYPRSKTLYTEDDWTDLSGGAGRIDYFRSKTLAERLAWEMARDSRRNPRHVPLTTVCPGFILGPSLVPWARYSLQTIKGMIDRNPPFSLDMMGHSVDVRDVALMHIAVMNNPSTDGHRHFCFGVTGKMVELPRIIRELYGERGLKPSTFVMPTWILGLLRFVVTDISGIYGKLGHKNEYRTKYPGVYRYAYTDQRRSVRDTIDSMEKHGWLSLKR